MNGVILRDVEIVRAMEADVAGRFIPVTLLKSGELRQSSALLSEPALRLVMRYVERLIATMAQTLLVGDVAADPLMHNLNACAWCPYTAVCGSERAEENAARVSMKKRRGARAHGNAGGRRKNRWRHDGLTRSSTRSARGAARCWFRRRPAPARRPCSSSA